MWNIFRRQGGTTNNSFTSLECSSAAVESESVKPNHGKDFSDPGYVKASNNSRARREDKSQEPGRSNTSYVARPWHSPALHPFQTNIAASQNRPICFRPNSFTPLSQCPQFSAMAVPPEQSRSLCNNKAARYFPMNQSPQFKLAKPLSARRPNQTTPLRTIMEASLSNEVCLSSPQTAQVQDSLPISKIAFNRSLTGALNLNTHHKAMPNGRGTGNTKVYYEGCSSLHDNRGIVESVPLSRGSVTSDHLATHKYTGFVSEEHKRHPDYARSITHQVFSTNDGFVRVPQLTQPVSPIEGKLIFPTATASNATRGATIPLKTAIEITPAYMPIRSVTVDTAERRRGVPAQEPMSISKNQSNSSYRLSETPNDDTPLKYCVETATTSNQSRHGSPSPFVRISDEGYQTSEYVKDQTMHEANDKYSVLSRHLSPRAKIQLKPVHSGGFSRCTKDSKQESTCHLIKKDNVPFYSENVIRIGSDGLNSRNQPQDEHRENRRQSSSPNIKGVDREQLFDVSTIFSQRRETVRNANPTEQKSLEKPDFIGVTLQEPCSESKSPNTILQPNINFFKSRSGPNSQHVATSSTLSPPLPVFIRSLQKRASTTFVGHPNINTSYESSDPASKFSGGPLGNENLQSRNFHTESGYYTFSPFNTYLTSSQMRHNTSIATGHGHEQRHAQHLQMALAAQPVPIVPSSLAIVSSQKGLVKSTNNALLSVVSTPMFPASEATDYRCSNHTMSIQRSLSPSQPSSSLNSIGKDGTYVKNQVEDSIARPDFPSIISDYKLPHSKTSSVNRPWKGKAENIVNLKTTRVSRDNDVTKEIYDDKRIDANPNSLYFSPPTGVKPLLPITSPTRQAIVASDNLRAAAVPRSVTSVQAAAKAVVLGTCSPTRTFDSVRRNTEYTCFSNEELEVMSRRKSAQLGYQLAHSNQTLAATETTKIANYLAKRGEEARATGKKITDDSKEKFSSEEFSGPKKFSSGLTITSITPQAARQNSIPLSRQTTVVKERLIRLINGTEVQSSDRPSLSLQSPLDSPSESSYRSINKGEIVPNAKNKVVHRMVANNSQSPALIRKDSSSIGKDNRSKVDEELSIREAESHKGTNHMMKAKTNPMNTGLKNSMLEIVLRNVLENKNMKHKKDLVVSSPSTTSIESHIANRAGGQKCDVSQNLPRRSGQDVKNGLSRSSVLPQIPNRLVIPQSTSKPRYPLMETELTNNKCNRQPLISLSSKEIDSALNGNCTKSSLLTRTNKPFKITTQTRSVVHQNGNINQTQTKLKVKVKNVSSNLKYKEGLPSGTTKRDLSLPSGRSSENTASHPPGRPTELYHTIEKAAMQSHVGTNHKSENLSKDQRSTNQHLTNRILTNHQSTNQKQANQHLVNQRKEIQPIPTQKTVNRQLVRKPPASQHLVNQRKEIQPTPNQQTLNRQLVKKTPARRQLVNQRKEIQPTPNQQTLNRSLERKPPASQHLVNQRQPKQRQPSQRPTFQRPTNQCPENERPANQRPANKKSTNEKGTNQHPSKQQPENQRSLNTHPSNLLNANLHLVNQQSLNKQSTDQRTSSLKLNRNITAPSSTKMSPMTSKLEPILSPILQSPLVPTTESYSLQRPPSSATKARSIVSILLESEPCWDVRKKDLIEKTRSTKRLSYKRTKRIQSIHSVKAAVNQLPPAKYLTDYSYQPRVSPIPCLTSASMVDPVPYRKLRHEREKLEQLKNELKKKTDNAVNYQDITPVKKEKQNNTAAKIGETENTNVLDKDVPKVLDQKYNVLTTSEFMMAAHSEDSIVFGFPLPDSESPSLNLSTEDSIQTSLTTLNQSLLSTSIPIDTVSDMPALVFNGPIRCNSLESIPDTTLLTKRCSDEIKILELEPSLNEPNGEIEPFLAREIKQESCDVKEVPDIKYQLVKSNATLPNYTASVDGLELHDRDLSSAKPFTEYYGEKSSTLNKEARTCFENSLFPVTETVINVTDSNLAVSCRENTKTVSTTVDEEVRQPPTKHLPFKEPTCSKLSRNSIQEKSTFEHSSLDSCLILNCCKFIETCGPRSDSNTTCSSTKPLMERSDDEDAGMMNYEAYMKELTKELEKIPDLSGRKLTLCPRKSFIAKRDKEMRKVKMFGWQYASTELQSILPTLSRFTIQHYCDTQKSRLTGLDGSPLICQTLLLSQISQGLQTRDVFGYYFRVGVPPVESINQRLNRFSDKRRIQNASRRFLENLVLSDNLLSLVAGPNGSLTMLSSVPSSFRSLERLRNCILLPESIAERTIVLSAIFTFLWNRFGSVHSLASPYSIIPLTNEKEPCLTLQELTTVLNELDLWPPETNTEDRHEIALSLLSSHPDLLPMLQRKTGVPHLIYRSVFINSLLSLPYNLPDFPTPEIPQTHEPKRQLKDSNLLCAALEICRTMLDVQQTSPLLYQRQQVSLSLAASVVLQKDKSSADSSAVLETENKSVEETKAIRKLSNKRLLELSTKGFCSLGLPPNSFLQQDIFFSQMMSVEELQSLLLLSSVPNFATVEQDMQSEFPCNFNMWDTRVLMRCLNVILGVVKECLTEAEWKWVSNPFCPNLPLPELSQVVCRCVELRDRLITSATFKEHQNGKFGYTGISPEAKVIASSPYSQLPPLLFTSDMSTSPGSVTTLQSTGESTESVIGNDAEGSSKIVNSVPRNPTSSLNVEAHPLSTRYDTSSPRLFAPVAPVNINWATFLEVPSQHQTFADEFPIQRPIPLDGNPLFYMPSAYRGMDDLWAMKTADADPAFSTVVASDPSGLLPVNVTSFQACCRIFEVLVSESGCFVDQLQLERSRHYLSSVRPERVYNCDQGIKESSNNNNTFNQTSCNN